MKPLQELYEKIAREPSLQKEFLSLLNQKEQEKKEVYMDRIVSFAKEQGYLVTAFEVDAFLQELANPAEGELSDAQLDMVAGGKSVGGAFTIAMSVFSAGILCVMKSIDRNNSDPQNGPPLECNEMFD